MSSQRYYLIAQGNADSALCGAFARGPLPAPREEIDRCNLRNPAGWVPESCDPFPGLHGFRCYFCDREAVNGNTHYYKMIAFSEDCRRGVYFSGSLQRPEDYRESVAWRQP